MADFAADMRCPRCAKHFKNEMAVLAHLNQPTSLCRLRDALFQAQKRLMVPQRHPQPQHNQTSTDDWDWTGNVTVDMDVDPEPPHPDLATVNSNPAPDFFITEEYEGAARTYGNGKTFMDKFDGDQYAKLRRDCLYYPFSTKEEWELAAYLLGSDLSMASIDKFLKLSLVSLSPLLGLTLKRYRSSILGFHSTHQKIYAAVPSFFLLGPNGSINRGKPFILPSVQFHSSFATLSNVFNPLWIAR